MLSVFHEVIKTGRQIKTKDQNLKKKYFLKSANGLDLLELSHEKIKDFIKRAKIVREKNEICDNLVTDRLKRYEELITECSNYVQSLREPKIYEKKVESLLDFSKTPAIRRKLMRIEKELLDNSSVDRTESKFDSFEGEGFLEFNE